jgi:hypothetical protein
MVSRSRVFLQATALTLLFLSSSLPAIAAPVLFVNDSRGQLATVDVATGAATIIGNTGVVLTDIAFSPSGELYGIDFRNLYRVDVATAQTALIGPHSIPAGNALAFDGRGTLFAAAAVTMSLFTIDTGTGLSTVLGSTEFASAGDLTFNAGRLFLSSTSNQLVQIDLASGFRGMGVGPFGVRNVLGLAAADTDQVFGVSGTNIFLIDPLTGRAMLASSFAGMQLGPAFGSAFRNASVPEPAAPLLILLGLAALRARRRTA